jgi:UDP-N-acetylmuramyl pentapeptide phosphotransferase/UDP-N-acetylglucosamine-1-phosphate transferase
LIYAKVWKKFRVDTPTGSGIILLFPLSLIFFQLNININLYLILLTLILIYYCDDLFGLNYKIRILLQCCASLILYYLYFEFYYSNLFLIIFLLFPFLVNVLNFQDGRDLNISLILFLVFLAIKITTDNSIINQVSLIIIILIILFSFFNKEKNNIYLGDSGCYAASVLIFAIILLEIDNLNLIKSVISILIFSILDVLFVLLYRLYKKENLLTRNYYHIYQFVFKENKYFLYLLPNLIISTINFLISFNLNFDLDWFLLILLINLFYLFLIRYFLNIRKA